MNAETTLVPITPDTILAREMARFVGDPLGFVLFAYPWGRAGTELEHEMGPDPVQKKFLTDLGEHVKTAEIPGHSPSHANHDDRHQRPRHRKSPLSVKWQLR